MRPSSSNDTPTSSGAFTCTVLVVSAVLPSTAIISLCELLSTIYDRFTQATDCHTCYVIAVKESVK